LITDYGWNEALQQAFAPLAAQGLQPARVLVQQRGLYRVATEAGEAEAQVSGRFRHDAEEGGFPVAGDWAAVRGETGGPALIEAVLPRRTAFVRWAAGPAGGRQTVAANVDLVLLAQAMDGDFSPRRLERYLALAYESGAAPVVLLTKADACPAPEALVEEAEAVAFGVPVLAVSAMTGEGLAGLAGHLAPGRTSALLGSSGVGKSTLVNALAGAELMATKAVRAHDQTGRHTTTHRELIRLPSGALILDTPGMRELGLVDAQAGVAAVFGDLEAEVAALAEDCRFRDCAHGSEPGCAVRAALEDGRLDPDRWTSWKKLQRELAHERRRDDPLARQAEEKRWIAISKAARQHMKDKRRIE
jgi:ribosome biogenesis GTPase